MNYSETWKLQRDKGAVLALEDGSVFRGYSVGAETDELGEVVFNTGMTGYQEIISDPSYAGQIVTMTYTEIGSVGINSADYESSKLHLSGFVVNSINQHSNWRSEEQLSDTLKKNNIPCIAGIDTRALTSVLRKKGTMKGFIHCSPTAFSEQECVRKAKGWCGLDNQDYASKVSCKEKYLWDADNRLSCSWGIADILPEIKYNIVAYDFGIKWNILRNMRAHGMKVTVVPAKSTAKEVLALKPDGVFFSNGPADPAAVDYAISAAKELIGKVPIMGICLGHQILGIASGADRYRLKFGHHGCNHPVKNLLSDKIEITSQNHNFAIDEPSIKNTKLEITHLNLNDNTVEGIRHKAEPMFAVQYHPEASPGPHDPNYLFKEFEKIMDR